MNIEFAKKSSTVGSCLEVIRKAPGKIRQFTSMSFQKTQQSTKRLMGAAAISTAIMLSITFPTVASAADSESTVINDLNARYGTLNEKDSRPLGTFLGITGMGCLIALATVDTWASRNKNH